MWKGLAPGSYFWLKIVVAVAIILGVFQIFRVNAPQTEPVSAPNVSYSSGVIYDGPLDIQSGEFLSFPINTNRRSALRIDFSTKNRIPRVEVLVIGESDLDAWMAGQDVKAISRTGKLPIGTLSPSTSPGQYRVIIDNRGGDKNVEMTAKIAVE